MFSGLGGGCISRRFVLDTLLAGYRIVGFELVLCIIAGTVLCRYCGIVCMICKNFKESSTVVPPNRFGPGAQKTGL